MRDSLDRFRDEMLKHRKMGLTFVQIGELYGVTKQRVGQVIKGSKRTDIEEEWILSHPDLTNTQIIEKTGKSYETVVRKRRKTRYATDHDQESSFGVGYAWEEWVSSRLTEMGIENILMPFSNRIYDILALGTVKIDVKSSKSRADLYLSQKLRVYPTYRFKVGNKKADLYVCVVSEYPVVFVIPSFVLPPRSDEVLIPYPVKGQKLSKYTQFLVTTKLLPETKRLAKQQAAARGMFLYEYLAELVNKDVIPVRMGEHDTVYFLDLNTGLMETKTANQ